MRRIGDERPRQNRNIGVLGNRVVLYPYKALVARIRQVIGEAVVGIVGVAPRVIFVPPRHALPPARRMPAADILINHAALRVLHLEDKRDSPRGFRQPICRQNANRLKAAALKRQMLLNF